MQDHFRIDALVSDCFPGVIGMASCPGIRTVTSFMAQDSHDLRIHLQQIKDWGACCLVTLLGAEELHDYGVPGLIKETELIGMRHYHLPIMDLGVPDQRFETAWEEVGMILRQQLATGRKIVLHCYAGMGRTGTIAARLLVEFGLDPELAIAQVRLARPGTIQTWTQENYIRQCQSLCVINVGCEPGSDE